MENITSLADALSDLRVRGYREDFFIDTFCLYCGDLDMRLNPEQFNVDEEYRFEGDAVCEEIVLVAITSSNGIKGIVVDSYESYSENTGLDSARMQRYCTVSAII